MFHFARKRAPGARGEGDRRRPRPPITIGFEQLEGREMLSAGIALSIIPAETRPLSIMPRPYIGTMDPESRPIVMLPRRDRSDDPGPDGPAGLWPPGGRFRMT